MQILYFVNCISIIYTYRQYCHDPSSLYAISHVSEWFHRGGDLSVYEGGNISVLYLDGMSLKIFVYNLIL